MSDKLRYAMMDGNFRGLSPESLSVASLSRRIPDDEFGRTFLHLAAKWGTLQRIPGLSLEDPAMGLTDAGGFTVMEISRKFGRGKSFDSTRATYCADQKTRSYDDHSGRSCSDPGLNHEEVEPHSFHPDTPPLTPLQEQIFATLNDGTPLPEGFKKEDLLMRLPNDLSGTTLIHLAAGKGKLGRFPLECLNSDMVVVRDNKGRTPLHRAATRKTLHLVPKHLFTRETLSATDNDGVSVVELLVRKGLTSLVPNEVLCSLPQFAEARLLEEIESENYESRLFYDFKLLSKTPFTFEFDGSWYHWFAAEGRLGQLPEETIRGEILGLRDSKGRSPLHVSVAGYGIGGLPKSWLLTNNLLTTDSNGRNAFHELASLEELGGASPDLFTREVLVLKCKNGDSVADILEEHGNTELLPPTLRHLSRSKALEQMDLELRNSFTSAENFWSKLLSPVIDRGEFEQIRNRFVRAWSLTRFDYTLDEEQAESVIASGRDLLVSARAGSGKTGTLVARALFEIEKRASDPRKIVILAFNKKAALEVRERLVEKTGEERCPHVMTFHSLAYRLVHPKKDSILLDEMDSEEGEALSQVLNSLIDDEIRRGDLVEEIRQIMALRWMGEWNQIVNSGGLLPQDEVLAFREAREFHAIDGRRFGTAMEKVVADELVMRGKKYYHRPITDRNSGRRYTPAFSVSESDQRVIIDIAGTVDRECLLAAERYWSGDRSSGAVRIELPDVEVCGGIEEFRRRLIAAFEGDDLGWLPLSDDLIWGRIKKRVIGDFTRSVVTFVGRCQKELWTPEILAEHFTGYQEQLESIKPTENPELKACIIFWQVCHRLFLGYLDHLKEINKMDFDHLMMNAVTLIRRGKTRFSSKWSHGDLAEVKHLFIDEYQDFSHLFNALREAIQNQNPSAKFFCVGDDWQAINGFAGSNLQYFHGFAEMFPNHRKLEVLMNYRSAAEIVELGNRVMKGLGSPSLPTREQKGRVCQIFTDAKSTNNDEWEEGVEEQLGLKAVPLLKLISRSMDEGKQLLVLFRNRTVWTSSRSIDLKVFRKELISWLEVDPRERVVFSTTHSYKGGESDHVVLVDPDGYPSLHPDRMFSQIFGDTDQSLSADERRLFYVGVTRAKEQLVFMRDHKFTIQHGNPVLTSIPFLEHEPLQTASLATVASKVEPKERCLVRISCGANSFGKRLNDAKFFYRKERNVWRRLIDKGGPTNRFECAEFLRALPWLGELENCSVEFVWRDRTEIFKFGDAAAVNQPAQVVRQEDQFQTTPSSPQILEGHQHISPKLDEGAMSKPIHAPLRDTSTRAPGDSKISGKTIESGVFNTDVVGMKYEGRMGRAMALSTGDFVRLEREPTHPKDCNAIKVVALGNSQIGYLSRHVAIHLAKGLDAWGGVTQAKITSIWKIPPPNIHVAVSICFPLPPGVVIPAELDSVARLEDNPFTTTLKSQQVSGPAPQQAVSPIEPTPTTPGSSADTTALEQSALGAAEREALELIFDARLQSLIKLLAIEQSIPFPTVGFDGGFGDVADGSMLEVAWPDYKIGIAIPTDDSGSFIASGWTILSATTVSAAVLRSLFQNDPDQPQLARMVPEGQPKPPPPIGFPPDDSGIAKIDQRYQNGPFSDDEPDVDVPF